MSEALKSTSRSLPAARAEVFGQPVRNIHTRLEVQPGPFVLNLHRANAFEWNRVVDRPGMPVDTTEWDMTVPTVNAYYDPSKNEMVFPAGALVPQTFDPNADDGGNYGSGCKVRMQRIGPWLLIEDGGGCGGAAVSFTGLYRREGKSTR